MVLARSGWIFRRPAYGFAGQRLEDRWISLEQHWLDLVQPAISSSIGNVGGSRWIGCSASPAKIEIAPEICAGRSV